MLFKPAEIQKIKANLTPGEQDFLREVLFASKGRVFYSYNHKELVYETYYQGKWGLAAVPLDGAPYYQGKLGLALAVYVYETDRSSSEEELKARYGGDYGELSLFASLSLKQITQYQKLLKDVDAFSREIVFHQEAPKTLPAVQFVFEPFEGRAQVSLRIGYERFYLVRKVLPFLQDYYEKGLVQFHKQCLNLQAGSFPSPIEDAFEYLYRVALTSFSSSSGILLSQNQLLRFLFLLEGQTVVWNDHACLIHEPITVHLKLNEQGRVEPEPSILGKGFFHEEEKGYSVDEGAIYLYQFQSKKAAGLYELSLSCNEMPESVVAPMLSERVLPALSEDELSISEGFTRKYPILRPRIAYYIGQESETSISCKTAFFSSSDEVSANAFSLLGIWHERQLEIFRNELRTLELPESGLLEGDEQIISFLKKDLSKLRKVAEVYVSEGLERKKVKGIPAFGLMTTSGEDWLSLSLTSSEYSPDELLLLYSSFRKKKRFVKLRDDYILLDEDDASFKRLAESFAPEDFGKHLPLYQALKVPALNGETDQGVRNWIDQILSYESLELPPLPEEIQAQHRPYQKNGIAFLYNLYRLGMSGMLSDDMGLGKTLQAFALFSMVKEPLPILVVCPKSLIYNWMDEKQKWAPDLKAYILDGQPKQRQALYQKMRESRKAIYFVSYDTLRNDLEQWQGIPFSLVLLDEGQYISNTHAMKTQAVKKLSAKSRFVLTGTPVQNSLLDLWSIFDFLLPGYFPPLSVFKEQYGGLEIASEESRKRLLSKIRPFMLGRKKKDVLQDLPDKETIHLSIAMSEEQRRIYEAYLLRARKALEEGESKINVLSAMTRLRQICVSPSLFLEGEFPTGKLDYLVTSLAELKSGGRKAIVFSSFVRALELVRKACKEQGLVTETIQGDTSAEVRLILAKRFNDPQSKIDVMLVSLKAGGTGLNLIGADTVFHLDPWWNLAAERQAEDRAHRIGQTNKVTVFKLVTKDSIEEKMLSLQEKKGLLVDLADEASAGSVLTEEDYSYLLS